LISAATTLNHQLPPTVFHLVLLPGSFVNNFRAVSESAVALSFSVNPGTIIFLAGFGCKNSYTFILIVAELASVLSLVIEGEEARTVPLSLSELPHIRISTLLGDKSALPAELIIFPVSFIHLIEGAAEPDPTSLT